MSQNLPSESSELQFAPVKSENSLHRFNIETQKLVMVFVNEKGNASIINDLPRFKSQSSMESIEKLLEGHRAEKSFRMYEERVQRKSYNRGNRGGLFFGIGLGLTVALCISIYSVQQDSADKKIQRKTTMPISVSLKNDLISTPKAVLPLTAKSSSKHRAVSESAKVLSPKQIENTKDLESTPFRFESFQAVLSDGTAWFKWMDGDFKETQFILQSSADGRNFTDEKIIDSATNENSPSYFATIENPNQYYRLKKINKGEAVFYSEIVDLKRTASKPAEPIFDDQMSHSGEFPS